MEPNYDYIQKGAKIWCYNPEIEKKKDPQGPPFICGEVTYLDKNKKLLEISSIDKKIRFTQTLPMINDEDINIDDMAAASDICEIDLLNNLTNRLNAQEQFTNVATTLLIVNPYKKDETIYSNEKIEYYIKYHEKNPPKLRKSNEQPHLFDLVLISIENLLKKGKNQAIIISGESGAGKTEAAKNAMKCIIYYFQGESKEERLKNINNFNSRLESEPLEKKILSCNPILEAFGNCKTLRNDNSSRFGKYVTLKIDFNTRKVIGASILTYLLEKSRVITQAKNERSFHIFYQLINCGDTELLDKLYLSQDPKNYNYLCNSNPKLKNINDAQMFKETKECFLINDFSEDEILNIFKIVAAVLLIGNIKFIKKVKKCDIENLYTVKNICELLQCEEEVLIKALTLKVNVINGESIESPLTLENCITSRDSLAKEIYNRLFLWIVKKMNSRLSPDLDIENENENIKYIGLLDIYGFECFDSNSLEQLCINYTNEQLQKLYINDFFQYEIDDLTKEGLSDKTGFIKFTDNQPIIDLIDLSPSGIFLKLDDCSFQDKDDKYFVEILKTELAKNKYVILPKIKDNMIIKIKHSAKEVPYDCNNFVYKNKDELKYSMVKIFANSKNNIIKKIFFISLTEEEANEQTIILEQNLKKKTNKFITGKFRAEIKSLMKELISCETNYVRCLKPNEQKKEFFVTPVFLFNQIKYLGILDTIKVRKQGFPSRKKYEEFFKDYFIPFMSIVKSKDSDKNKVQQIIKGLIPNLSEIHNDLLNPKYLLGKSKIFMKQDFNILLETNKQQLIKKMINSCEIIKTALNKFHKTEKLEYIKNQTANFQRFYRYNIKKISRKKKLKKIKMIQSAIKAYTSKNIISLENKRHLILQNILRTFIAKKTLEKRNFEMKCISMRLYMLSDEIERRKKIRMKLTAKYLIQSAVNNVIWNKYNQMFQKLRPYFESFIARQRYQEVYQKAKLERYRFNKIMMMQAFQSSLLLGKIKEKKLCNKIIHKNFITTISSNYFFKMRESTLVIQYYLSRYIKKKNTIKKLIISKYEEDNKEQQNNEAQLYLNIYPMIRFLKENNQYYQYGQDIYTKDFNYIDNYNNINKKIQKKIRRCSSMQKIESNINIIPDSNRLLNNNDINNNKKINKISNVSSQYFNIGSEYLKNNPDINNKLVLLEQDELNLPKVDFFARIMALDMIVDLNEIYELNWSEEFRDIYDKNMYNHTPIQLISIGDTSTMMVNSLGKIYTFGWNNNSQCGINNKASIKNFILPEINKEEINSNINSKYPLIYYEKSNNISNKYGITANYINIFNESCFVINDKGDCFSFGNNENGQLGLGNPFPVNNIAFIRILKGNTKSIKSCQDFTISLTNDNEVYLWYYQSKNRINKLKTNIDFINNKTKLSNKSKNSYSRSGYFEESKDFTDYIESGINNGVPFKINFLNKKIKIAQISCGYNFSMLLSSDGILFGLGNNKNGELGVIHNEEELNDPNLKLNYFHSPIQNIILSDIYKEKIISVKCGFKHTICLTSGKRVYGWGKNTNGQLGLGNYVNQLIPVQIFINIIPLEKIIQIQAGFRSSIFLTENRNIYYTGILDKDNISNFPTKFNVKIKSPEICVENKFHIVRILTTWSKNASIFYVTVADIRRFNTKIIHKLNKVIEVLSKNWKDENVKCPRINTISNYFSPTYMK
mgnify:CR=1 FL=1